MSIAKPTFIDLGEKGFKCSIWFIGSIDQGVILRPAVDIYHFILSEYTLYIKICKILENKQSSHFKFSLNLCLNLKVKPVQIQQVSPV